MSRTSQRGGPQTQARIRQVANLLFDERGFDAVTVAEVAREAGVSSVTVFKHFPRKEDLYLDRQQDAAELLINAVRGRAPGTGVVAALRAMTFGLIDARHPLSGVDPRTLPFFGTVAASPALIARSRQIAAELQEILAAELQEMPDGALLAGLFIAGYATVMTRTARRLLAGEPEKAVLNDHRARFDRLFDALGAGFSG